MAAMETVVAVAIGILATVFLASLVGLILVCRHKFCRRTDLLGQQMRDTRPDVQLIDSDLKSMSEGDVELGDVEISNPRLEQLIRDTHWVDDVSGLIPHCIAILKTCHLLTERLVGMTMGSAEIYTQEMLTDIITIAKRINPRVDDVVQCMYPPLDPRLLEARCTALVLSVSHLVLVTKNACKSTQNMDWIDQALADVEDHLKGSFHVLQEASFSLAPDCRSPSSSVASGDSQQPIMNGHVQHIS
ncbi:transmembrane protein 98-like [Dreissena polymorpha]|uniref:transmembrane protein 98-like n=1 Tax=Dreissena polymorpha TaxID=45954 RepID=UPI00226455FC|nr:transmembrane protein 98-like [Dreissena polymorpha]